MFSYFRSKNTTKRRSEYIDDVKIFIQVHYVRERSSERYKFNTLTIKTDPERDACHEWYELHNNPTVFSEIVSFYFNEKSIKPDQLFSQYKLDSSVLTNTIISKGDAVAVCLGLHLNYSESKALLKTLDYALTNSLESDLALRYCIENEIYNLSDVEYILSTVCNTSLKEIL